MPARFLRHSLEAEGLPWARRKVLGLATAQSAFALVTIAIGAGLSSWARAETSAWSGFAAGLATTVALTNAAAIVGLLRGRMSGAHLGFLAVAPYPLACAASIVSGLVERGPSLGLLVPVVVLALLAAHAQEYLSDETREALALWRARRASDPATARR